MHSNLPVTSLGRPAYDVETLRKFKVQAIELPGTRTSDAETGAFDCSCLSRFLTTDDASTTGIFRSVLSPATLTKYYPNIKSIHDFFENGVATNPNGPCLGHRRIIGRDPRTNAPKWSGYLWQSYAKCAERRTDLGRGLQKLYVDLGAGGSGDKWNLGIYSVRRTNRDDFS